MSCVMAKAGVAGCIRAIRRLSASGVTQYELAARFGVTQASVSKVVRRKTWRNVG